MSAKPRGRICVVCGKPHGVTFFAVAIEQRMRSVPAHVPCVAKLRRSLTAGTPLQPVVQQRLQREWDEQREWRGVPNSR